MPALLAVLALCLLWKKQSAEKRSHRSNLAPSADTSRVPRPFTLIPHKGVGLLSFGDTAEEVRALLGEEDQDVAQMAEGVSEVSYSHLGSSIQISDSDGIVAFKFFRPASPYYDGEDLLGLPFIALAKKFSELDKTTAMAGDGLIRAPALGITAYAPSAEHAPNEPAAFIQFTCKGYRAKLNRAPMLPGSW